MKQSAMSPRTAYNRTGYCQRAGHSLGDPVSHPARLTFAYGAGRLYDAPVLCGVRAGYAKGCMQLFSPSFLGEERPAAVLLHFIQRHLSAVQRGDLYCRQRQLQGAGTGRIAALVGCGFNVLWFLSTLFLGKLLCSLLTGSPLPRWAQGLFLAGLFLLAAGIGRAVDFTALSGVGRVLGMVGLTVLRPMEAAFYLFIGSLLQGAFVRCEISVPSQRWLPPAALAALC